MNYHIYSGIVNKKKIKQKHSLQQKKRRNKLIELNLHNQNSYKN